MTRFQARVKRGCDVLLSGLMLVLCSWLIVVLWIVAAVETRRNGIFTQERIGLGGRPFIIYKIRTMRDLDAHQTHVTASSDPRITRIGAWLRRTKLDELPQLLNVLIGDMSLVGPRPDTAEYAALLGDDGVILTVRPGLTGPATLMFMDEQEVLAKRDDPDRYNREVIFPAKVKINRHYVDTYTFGKDLVYLAATLVPALRGRTLAASRALLQGSGLRRD
jgi:lipopolysaccharide/colanic/teichoic acid biosynthesis glycosyltransferase